MYWYINATLYWLGDFYWEPTNAEIDLPKVGINEYLTECKSRVNHVQSLVLFLLIPKAHVLISPPALMRKSQQDRNDTFSIRIEENGIEVAQPFD